MTWTDPTAPPPLAPLSRAYTTVYLPKSNNPTNPYRYLISWHYKTGNRQGFGACMPDLDVPLESDAVLQSLTDWVTELARVPNPKILNATLLAGPDPNMRTMQVPVAGRYRYLVGIAHATGNTSSIVETDDLAFTTETVDRVYDDAARQKPHIRNGTLLALTLLAAPPQ